MRLAVLGSTNGTDLIPVVEAINSGRLLAEVKVVLSNNELSGILKLSLIHISEPTRPY